MYTPNRIGTPLSANATKVLLLGAGELGKEVTIAFQRLGVEVHAADRYQNAPAQLVANFSYTLDMTDPQALKDLVHQVRPHFVVPEIEALATGALLDLEAEGFTVVPTARATQLTMDREGIRCLAAQQLGVPTGRYAFAGSVEECAEAAASVGFPCVIKPVMSSSGKGQSIAHNPAEVAAAWEYAQEEGRVAGERVIVEEFIDFDYEVTLLTVRALSADTGEVATYFCEPIGHRQEQGDYTCSWQPAPMAEGVLAQAQDIAHRVTAALGGRGLFGVELFVRGDEVFFSEVSPRPHDTGMVTMASQRFSEFELHARAILALPVDVQLISPGASVAIRGGVEGPNVMYEGLAAALSVPTADVRIFGKPLSHERRRMGVALATGADTAQALRRARTAASHIYAVIPD